VDPTQLCREYEAWCGDNKLPYMPAHELSTELDCARDLTGDVRKIDRITHQLQWLATFINRCEKVTCSAQNDFPPLESLPERGEEELWDYLEEFYKNMASLSSPS
jgi:hypothetical protein